jgi:hypothetical protein
LSKPFLIPRAEEFAEAKAKFNAEHVTLQATALVSGRQLAKLCQDSEMGMTEPAIDLTLEASKAFAVLADYVRDYRDSAAYFSEVDKLDIYQELDECLNELKTFGVSMCYSTRKVKIKFGGESSEALLANILYVVGFTESDVPETFAVPKAIGVRW